LPAGLFFEELGACKIMTQTEANALVGRKVENLRTGHQFVVRDFVHGSFHLSGGQIIPPDAMLQFWKMVTL
jgi:hypothetical protein